MEYAIHYIWKDDKMEDSYNVKGLDELKLHLKNWNHNETEIDYIEKIYASGDRVTYWRKDEKQ